MRNKFYSKQPSVVSKSIIPISLILTLIIAEGFLVFLSNGTDSNGLRGISEDLRTEDKISEGINANSIVNSWERVDYENLVLNSSISFDLNSTSSCSEIHFNFTSINETRDFVSNGDFNVSSVGWNAINETDVNYTWTDTGVVNTKCISINLTGLESQKMYRPLKNGAGLDNFQNASLEGWYLYNNDSSDFTQMWGVLNNGTDGSGSLMHRYSGPQTEVGIANSTYEFNYDSKYQIVSGNLNFYYKWDLQKTIFSPNKVEIGVYIDTPTKSYLINDWNITYYDDPSPEKFYNKSLQNIEKYFNESGTYNLTFYTKHFQVNANTNNEVWFDNIELNITWGLNEFWQNDTVVWNHTIDFPNRDVFSDGILNLSYYTTEKFNNINNSDVYLSVWVNDNRIDIDNLENMENNTWINSSISINKNIIDIDPINISVGLFFNATTQIFINESLSIFFDNISFTLGTNPHPLELDLQISSPDSQLNDTFIVDRDAFNNDFVNVSNSSFTWSAGQTHWLNITSNSSNTLVNITISYYLSQDVDDTNGNGGGPTPPLEPKDFTLLIIVLIIAMSITSFLFVIRVQKRTFLNPKYDYIKKLKLKRKIDIKREKLAPVEAKRMCQTCRKPINLTAQFCEHCGQPQ